MARMSARPILGGPLAYGSHGIERRLGLIRRYTELRGSRGLDVGCGNGSYTVRIAQGVDEMHGIDIEPERLSQLPSTIHTHLMPAEQMEFPDDHFDVVTCIEVLEHVEDVRRTIAEIHRVLRPGGTFAWTVPNRLFPFETHEITIAGRTVSGKFVPFVSWFRPLHRRVANARMFTRSQMRTLLRTAGFHEVGTTWMMPPLDGMPGGRYFRKVGDLLERTPLRMFGVSVVGVWQKD
jgi:ubiquinone/menaquinone biosynthesis C-methylase UbiE